MSLFLSINRNSFTIEFVAPSASNYFDSVFSAVLDTMQAVLFVDWENGFGRLWEISFSLYPQELSLTFVVVNNTL